MQIALSLLISAMQLLTLVSTTPNLSPEFKDSAILIANQAIATAKEEIAKANETAVTPVSVPVVPASPLLQPVFGGIITPMEETSEITIKNVATHTEEGLLFPVWVIKIDILDEKKIGEYKEIQLSLGKIGESKLVTTMSAQDQFVPWNTNNMQKRTDNTFWYSPTSKGSKTITFTSGQITKTLTINVE